MRLALAFFTCLFNVSAFAEFAPMKVTVCIGLYSDRCPQTTDVYRDCDSNIADVAKEICTFHGKDGSITPGQSAYFETSFVKGNRCDYHNYLVYCLPPSR